MPLGILRFLLLALLCNTAYADKQEDLNTLRKRIAEMQREVEKTSASESAVADALRESERNISNSNRKISELHEQQQQADITLNKLQKNEQQLSRNLQSQQQLLEKLLYQQYVGGQQEYLRLLLNSQNPSEISRNLQYYQYIAKNRASWLNTLRTDLDTLKRASAATLAQSAELAALRAEQAEQTKKLEKEQAERQQLRSKIAQQLQLQRREINRLQRDENRLAELINRISQMLAKQKKPSKRSEKQNTPTTSPEQRNEQLPSEQFVGSPFNLLRGKLALPVKGVISNRFGTPRPESNVAWKGLFLKTPSGQPVKAIAPGRVVFSDWMRGFGNLMVIDHGNGYMSVYGNNETLYKQVGDTLRGGETIASVGNSGGNEDSGLYFELRYESKPFDPMTWVAKQ